MGAHPRWDGVQAGAELLPDLHLDEEQLAQEGGRLLRHPQHEDDLQDRGEEHGGAVGEQQRGDGAQLPVVQGLAHLHRETKDQLNNKHVSTSDLLLQGSNPICAHIRLHLLLFPARSGPTEVGSSKQAETEFASKRDRGSSQADWSSISFPSIPSSSSSSFPDLPSLVGQLTIQSKT